MEPDFIVSLINNYLKYYQQTNNIKLNNMFDEIDENERSSTNLIIEQFYNDLTIFKTLENVDLIENPNVYIINKNNNYFILKLPKKLIGSPSLFSLIYYITKENINTTDVEIIRMK